jgi:osmotically-inducible protein OsmY
MYNDTEIQKDIAAELKWEPSLRNDDIAVGVRDGVVTLGGFVDSYADKKKAERLAARIKGVKAIANELEVKLPSFSERADPDIARAALEHLKWNVSVPQDRIQLKVTKGWITLEGQVQWQYQKDAAEKAVRNLTGVKGVTNLVTMTPQALPRDVKKRIRDALHRTAQFDADRIFVETEGDKIVLEGTVRSYAELHDVERAARNAPGVHEVDCRIAIAPALATV